MSVTQWDYAIIVSHDVELYDNGLSQCGTIAYDNCSSRYGTVR